MISLTANRTNTCTRPWWHLRYKVQNVLTSKAKQTFLKKSYREEKMANCSPVSSWSSHEREEQNHTLSPIRDLEITHSGNGYGTYSHSPNQGTRKVRSRTHEEKLDQKKKVLLQQEQHLPELKGGELKHPTLQLTSWRSYNGWGLDMC